MATRKKNTETPKVDNGSWPKIQQGSHLTVKTFEDGRTELAWDDEQLLAEVRAAILKAESNIPASEETQPTLPKTSVKKATPATKKPVAKTTRQK